MCGEWSRLSLDEIELRVGTIQIVGALPTLLCDQCGLRRLPLVTKSWMCSLAATALEMCASYVKVDVANAPAAHDRFGFCSGVDLKYSALDTKYIPGLAVNAGFLTPVFFSKDALTYFYHHPDYTVTFESDTYGTLRGIDGLHITFGLTRAGKLLMWLGDLEDLPRPALMTLVGHNLESDHDIGCEFYEGQIEAEFTDLSREKHILRAQSEFAAELFQNHRGLKLLQLDNEAIALMSALRKPIHFSESEFGDAMEVMTKLFIERINVAVLKDDVRPVLSKDEADRMKKFGSLKTLETWLKVKVACEDASKIMLPLFVLYDLRVAYKHLIPTEDQIETKASCVKRLGLLTDASLAEIYEELTGPRWSPQIRP